MVCPVEKESELGYKRPDKRLTKALPDDVNMSPQLG